MKRHSQFEASAGTSGLASDDFQQLVEHLIVTQGGDAAAVAEGIAASAEASGNSAQLDLWRRVRAEIGRRQ